MKNLIYLFLIFFLLPFKKSYGQSRAFASVSVDVINMIGTNALYNNPVIVYNDKQAVMPFSVADEPMLVAKQADSPDLLFKVNGEPLSYYISLPKTMKVKKISNANASKQLVRLKVKNKVEAQLAKGDQYFEVDTRDIGLPRILNKTTKPEVSFPVTVYFN